MAAGARDNPARATNALLARCLVEALDEDGTPMAEPHREALGTRLLSDLTMGDRALIERAFRDQMPGVDLTREVDCDGCGRPNRAALDLTGFFSPSPPGASGSGKRSSPSRSTSTGAGPR